LIVNCSQTIFSYSQNGLCADDDSTYVRVSFVEQVPCVQNMIISLSIRPEKQQENAYENTTPEDTSELARKNAIKAKQHVRPIEAYTPSKNMFSPSLRTEHDSNTHRLRAHEEETADSSGEFDLDQSGYSTDLVEIENHRPTTPPREVLATQHTVARQDSPEEVEAQGMDEDGAEEEEDVFNPYHFIAHLPEYQSVSAKNKRCLPPISCKKPTLVLDLDETLVHCTVEPVTKPDLIFPVQYVCLNCHILLSLIVN
jgi:hypothetical protein